MKLFSYSDIQEITQKGISLKDGTFIDFIVCVRNACEYFNNDVTSCVAERNSYANPPYFEFFSDERVKIEFNTHKGLFAKKKNYDDFRNLQQALQDINYTTYDLS